VKKISGPKHANLL
jgi:hypothetical protein